MRQTIFKRFLVVMLLFSVCFSISEIYADDTVQDPLTYMKHVSTSLLASLNAHKADLGNHRVVSKIIYEKVVPHFDLGTMARSVLGRHFWDQATPTQRKDFIHEFTDMIVNTYASAVEQYDGDTIKFHPLRSNYDKYRLISLSSHVIRPNGNKILLVYKLIRRGKQWRVYDFSIESISMVSSYRSQFSGVLHKSGVEGLIARLKTHNSKVNRG